MHIIISLLLFIILSLPVQAQARNEQIATFAGGCFWCVESDFDKVNGVLKTISGYMGGHKKDPTYTQVSSGVTGHAEVVQITFDADIIDYAQLLEIFWHSIDPTVVDQQFCDHGDQYRSAIFVHNSSQQQLAEKSKQRLIADKPFETDVVTRIEPASQFYPAEDYHQNYHQTNPIRYQYYRFACGRDARLKELWGNKN